LPILKCGNFPEQFRRSGERSGSKQPLSYTIETLGFRTESID